ncbi:uncharacterized protein LOC117574809 isoform X3 [Drosophila albomicans]|nr:uncharacterized protein LOC117574809 isoform X3 [Drosophila albomicans]
MKLNFKLNLMIFCSWWVIISNCLAVCEIGAYCLREMPRAAKANSGSRTRHMWQPRHPTGLVAPADAAAAAETGSCNRPTTLRPATDSNVAASQQLNGIGNATIQAAAAAAASPAVTLANYVYQCAAKRASSSSNSCASNSNDNISQLEQQLTVLQS